MCMLKCWQAGNTLVLLMRKLSCNQRGHTVKYRVSPNDRCSVYTASIGAIPVQPLIEG